MRSALYEGRVMHARRTPTENVFSYPVQMWLLDLDELADVDRRLPLFGWNRRALVTLRDRDHLDVRAYLAEHGVDLGPDGRILVLTNLRVAGYVFNPVSFFWCYRGDGGLECVVAEVNNTFGETLPYLLRGGAGRYETDKRLHVSPFMPLDQSYTWLLSEPEERLLVRMDVHDREGRPLVATLNLRRRELTTASMLRALARYPMMPVQVIGLIHWQALRLWLKRTPFHRKPPFVPGKGSLR